MGRLGKALDQFDDSPATIPAGVAPADQSLGIHSPIEDATNSASLPEFDETRSNSIDPTASVTFFADPSVERILDFAESAMEAARRNEVTDSWIDFLNPLAAQEAAEPASEDSLASVAVDRSFGRFWDNVSGAMVNPPPWAIIIAGAGPDGDAVWISPTAIAFAQRHPGQVLIVDATAKTADPIGRRSGELESHLPTGHGLSELLGLSCRFGLTDVLRGTVDWRDAVEPTAMPRIRLLAAGGTNAPTDSALKSAAATLIAEWKSSYQLVLIHAADATDRRLGPLVAAADGTLLSVEVGRTSRAACSNAANSLYAVGARLLGCVVRD